MAIKLIRAQGEHQYALVKLLRELQIMEHLGGSRVQKEGFDTYYTGLITAFCPSDEIEDKVVDHIFLVMPLGEHTLHQVMEQTVLSEAELKHIFYNLLCAVNYLHSSNIVHRDLKPQNILVDKMCAVRLCDFGLSRTLP